MTDRPRRRYRVRLRTALAGSMFAAAAAASLTGITAAPAFAAPPRTVSASTTMADDDGVHGLVVTPRLTIPDLNIPHLAAQRIAEGPADAPAYTDLPVNVRVSAPADRLAGVRADLDRAVLLRLVTSDQAEAFYLQIERRVAAGL